MIDKSTFCVAPFIHQSMKTDGSIKACCRSLPAISNVREEPLSEAWNNPLLKQMRLDLTSGETNKRCRICFDQEEQGVKSLRQKYNSNQDRYARAIDVAERMEEDGTVNDSPQWIEFKLSNLCNLKCRMCHPLDSTKWFNDYKLVEHLHEDQWQHYLAKAGVDKKPLLNVFDEDFHADVKQFLDNVDYLQFAGGEPLYDDAHYEILEIVRPRAHEITLNYATNMTVLSTKKYNVLDFWRDFKSVMVSASIDGPPGLNDYIRGGAERYDIELNVKRVNELPNCITVGKPTIQALNIYYLPELFEWIKQNNFKQVDHHFVTFPKFLDCRIWTGRARMEIDAKLQNYYENQTDERTRNVLDNILTFFRSAEMYEDQKWDDFLEYNRILDDARDQNYKDYAFFREYMKDRK